MIIIVNLSCYYLDIKTKLKMKKLNFIDLFSGCGGLSEGFLETRRFNGLAHIEWERPMVETLRNRLIKKWNHSKEDAEKRVIRFDIQRTDELFYGNWSSDTKKIYERDNAKSIVDNGLDSLVGDSHVHIIIGGPPCQAYSIAGRAQDPNSMKNDYRNYLFESYAKVVAHYKPDLFVFENVPGLLTATPGNVPVRQRIFEAFQQIGYTIRAPEELKKSIFCAADYNTPQERKRIIIFGVRNDSCISLDSLYAKLSSLKKRKKKTVKDAIGEFPKFKPLASIRKEGKKNISHIIQEKTNLTRHCCRYINYRDQMIFEKWISQNMNKASTAAKKRFYTEVTGKKSEHIKYRNLEWDKPSPTIVAHLYKDGLLFIHPDLEQRRSITIREAAALQSFPNDFEFIGSDSYAYKMIGNAVPVEFAYWIATAVYKVIN